MPIIDCKVIREEILNDVKSQLAELKGTPRLCIVTIGNDDASKVYVRNKIKTAKELGIDVKHLQLDDDICQEEAEQVIEAICNRSTNHAVMLQLPIPSHLNKDRLLNVIPQHKDVDGLTDLNMGMLVNNREDAIVPATAQGVYEILRRMNRNDDLSWVNVTVVNRSQLIGKPLQALLTNHNATVTLCHSKSDYDFNDYFVDADVVVTGIGHANYYFSDNFYNGQTIIDCSMNRDEDGHLCGDVDYKDVLAHGRDIDITPVPSGVGILTTACLMLNVVKTYKLQGGE